MSRPKWGHRLLTWHHQAAAKTLHLRCAQDPVGAGELRERRRQLQRLLPLRRADSATQHCCKAAAQRAVPHGRCGRDRQLQLARLRMACGSGGVFVFAAALAQEPLPILQKMCNLGGVYTGFPSPWNACAQTSVAGLAKQVRKVSFLAVWCGQTKARDAPVQVYIEAQQAAPGRGELAG